MLTKIADFYEEEVDAAVGDLMTAMEPAHDRRARRHRRRHRHFDVSANLLAGRTVEQIEMENCEYGSRNTG